MRGTGGVQQQARGLDRVSADDDCTGSLEVFASFAIEIDDTVDAAVAAQADARSHCVGSNLRAMGDGIRHVRDQRAGLGSHFASLETEAAIDAVRPVAV
jgi:hypothetical protein